MWATVEIGIALAVAPDHETVDPPARGFERETVRARVGQPLQGADQYQLIGCQYGVRSGRAPARSAAQTRPDSTQLGGRFGDDGQRVQLSRHNLVVDAGVDQLVPLDR